jgi:hypothetical protein
VRGAALVPPMIPPPWLARVLRAKSSQARRSPEAQERVNEGGHSGERKEAADRREEPARCRTAIRQLVREDSGGSGQYREPDPGDGKAEEYRRADRERAGAAQLATDQLYTAWPAVECDVNAPLNCRQGGTD